MTSGSGRYAGSTNGVASTLLDATGGLRSAVGSMGYWPSRCGRHVYRGRIIDFGKQRIDLCEIGDWDALNMMRDR